MRILKNKTALKSSRAFITGTIDKPVGFQNKPFMTKAKSPIIKKPKSPILDIFKLKFTAKAEKETPAYVLNVYTLRYFLFAIISGAFAAVKDVAKKEVTLLFSIYILALLKLDFKGSVLGIFLFILLINSALDLMGQFLTDSLRGRLKSLDQIYYFTKISLGLIAIAFILTKAYCFLNFYSFSGWDTGAQINGLKLKQAFEDIKNFNILGSPLLFFFLGLALVPESLFITIMQLVTERIFSTWYLDYLVEKIFSLDQSKNKDKTDKKVIATRYKQGYFFFYTISRLFIYFLFIFGYCRYDLNFFGFNNLFLEFFKKNNIEQIKTLDYILFSNNFNCSRSLKQLCLGLAFKVLGLGLLFCLILHFIRLLKQSDFEPPKLMFKGATDGICKLWNTVYSKTKTRRAQSNRKIILAVATIQQLPALTKIASTIVSNKATAKALCDSDLGDKVKSTSYGFFIVLLLTVGYPFFKSSWISYRSKKDKLKKKVNPGSWYEFEFLHFFTIVMLVGFTFLNGKLLNPLFISAISPIGAIFNLDFKETKESSKVLYEDVFRFGIRGQFIKDYYKSHVNTICWELLTFLDIYGDLFRTFTISAVQTNQIINKSSLTEEKSLTFQILRIVPEACVVLTIFAFYKMRYYGRLVNKNQQLIKANIETNQADSQANLNIELDSNTILNQSELIKQSELTPRGPQSVIPEEDIAKPSTDSSTSK